MKSFNHAFASVSKRDSQVERRESNWFGSNNDLSRITPENLGTRSDRYGSIALRSSATIQRRRSDIEHQICRDQCLSPGNKGLFSCMDRFCVRRTSVFRHRNPKRIVDRRRSIVQHMQFLRRTQRTKQMQSSTPDKVFQPSRNRRRRHRVNEISDRVV